MKDPTAESSIAGNGNILVQASGSARVSVNAHVALASHVPRLFLTDFSARTERASRDHANAGLLSPYRSDVVELLGRDGEIDDLQRWLDSSRTISVRVLTGGAGRGKTRLSLELVRKANALGWLAGFATERELNRFRGQQNVSRWSWDLRTLIVVDYAATRANQLRDWLNELVDAPAAGVPNLRILLIERQAKREVGWLSAVIGHGQDDASRAVRGLLDPPEPVELSAIGDLADRRRILEALLLRTRTNLNPPALFEDVELDRLLGDEKWSGDPLFLMMAGLVAGECGIKDALMLSRADLATTIAHRELKRIGDIAASCGIDAADRRHPGFLLCHVAVAATLRQGVAVGEARQLIKDEAEAIGRSVDLIDTVNALRDALGQSETEEISPILPDIVGEAAILIWLGDRGVLAQSGGEPEGCVDRTASTARSRVSEVLVRTAMDFVAAERNEPIEWLDKLSRTTDVDLSGLMEIANQLPVDTLVLRELAADFAQRIDHQLKAQLDRVQDDDAAEPLKAMFATSRTNLGVRLAKIGRYEDALSASLDAVQIRRSLAQRHPDAFLPDLAMSLNNLGEMLFYLGRHGEALAASQEATEKYSLLAQSRPGFFRNLADSVKNLGARFSVLGRHEDALAAYQLAVNFYRGLTQEGLEVFLPDLAGCLLNLGIALSKLGRCEDALAASQEAVKIRRRLAQRRPDAFLPSLAKSVHNLGIRLADLGRLEEALAASQEAVDINFRLAQSHPDAFLPDLARSIVVHLNALASLNRYKEAVQEAVEALRILLPRVERNPDIYEGLARAIAEVVIRYGDQGGEPPDQALLEHAARVLGPLTEAGVTRPQ